MGRRPGDEQIEILEALRRTGPEVMIADVPVARHSKCAVREEELV